MRAVTYDRYGGPETHRLVHDEPSPQPGPGQALIRVTAAGVNPYDWHIYRGDPWIARAAYGLRQPGHRVLGSDVAGTVEALGEGVEDVAIGDAVCGVAGLGACADLVAVGSDRLARIPGGVSHEDAAAIPMAALTAIAGLEPHDPAGKRVLVIGASGGVGHMAVQIACALGASRVAAVCSGRNAAMVESLGADRVIDYTRERVTECGESFDVVFDTVGTTPLRRLRHVIDSDGIYAPAGGLGGGALLGPAWPMYRSVVAGWTVSQRVRLVMGKDDASGPDLARIMAWVSAGHVRPVIERAYPLAEHAQALARLETQHVAGKIVLRVD